MIDQSQPVAIVSTTSGMSALVGSANCQPAFWRQFTAGPAGLKNRMNFAVSLISGERFQTKSSSLAMIGMIAHTNMKAPYSFEPCRGDASLSHCAAIE